MKKEPDHARQPTALLGRGRSGTFGMRTRNLLLIALGVSLGGCATPPSTVKRSDNLPEKLSDYPRFAVEWKSEKEVTVELKLVRNSDDLCSPVMGLVIDGIPEYFLVDTGAQFTVVRRSFLSRHAHRETQFQSVVESFRHDHTEDIFSVGVIDLGFAVIREMPATFSPDADLEWINSELAKAGHPVLSGAVGLDFLIALGASIDLRESKVVMKRPNQAPGPAAPSKEESAAQAEAPKKTVQSKTK